MGNLLQ